MDPLANIREKARKNQKKIILPESGDERVLEAGFLAARKKIARILFLGHDIAEIKGRLRRFGRFDESRITVTNPKESGLFVALADAFYEKRKHKNVDKNYCREILYKNPVYVAAMMVDRALADGFVAGASNLTKDVVKAAIQCIGVDKRIGVASGAFIIFIKGSPYGDKGLFLFADCALVPDPDPKQLAGISVSAARLYEKIFNKKPYIAMLSYSTKSSAQGPLVDKIKKALEETKKLRPDLMVDGELQVDSAIDKAVAARKTSIKGSVVAGRANVLVFPNLDSGNIGYKLVQRLAAARAVGPLIMGVKKPCSDLSRGCSINDIVDAIASTAVLA